MTTLMCLGYMGKANPTNIHNAVDHVVYMASYNASGSIEQLESRVRKLVELVGSILETLPPETVVRILNDVHFETFTLEQE